MILRNYQNNAVASTLESWGDGNRSALGVMPTGTGKTIVFSSIIRRKFPKRAMVIAHRQELIWQAKDKIQRITGFKVGVEMGEHKSQTDSALLHPKDQVVVSTVQTHVAGGDGGGRIGKFDPMDFGLLIIDEAHHATSPSYRKILDYYMTNPNLVVLGVTATPDRADEEALGQIFDVVAFDYEILDAINEGWLVPIEQQMVSVDSLDFSDVRTTCGDLNGADLAAIMEAEKNLHGIAGATIDIVGDRRGIGFAASVNQAQVLSEIFNRHRKGMSQCVSAKTDKDDRKQIIRDFSDGKIQWLWNCGVFTEGFDDAGVEIISMARPTKSRSLYAQMAGRATRPHESIAHSLNDSPNNAHRRWCIGKSAKPSCLIIDFVGNAGKHKLMSTADILGGNISDEAIEEAKKQAVRSGRPVRMQQALIEEEEKAIKAKESRDAEAARKARLVAKTSYRTHLIDPFDILQIKKVKTRGWDQGKQFSEKQRNVLKGFGINPDEIDYANGKKLIGALFERREKKLCTLKQAATLKRFGYDPDVSFDEANKMIDRIAKNNWQKPVDLPPPVSVENNENEPF